MIHLIFPVLHIMVKPEIAVQLLIFLWQYVTGCLDKQLYVLSMCCFRPQCCPSASLVFRALAINQMLSGSSVIMLQSFIFCRLHYGAIKAETPKRDSLDFGKLSVMVKHKKRIHFSSFYAINHVLPISSVITVQCFIFC